MPMQGLAPARFFLCHRPEGFFPAKDLHVVVMMQHDETFSSADETFSSAVTTDPYLHVDDMMGHEESHDDQGGGIKTEQEDEHLHGYLESLFVLSHNDGVVAQAC